MVDILLNKQNRFIQKSRESHETIYDYSLVNYVNSETKVTIICPHHGPFEQKPSVHIRGSDCPFCSRIKQVKKRSTTEDFITKANLVHKGYYNYDKTSYTLVRNKVVITCPVHGDFEQKANSHLNGFGCLSCGIEKTSDSKRLDVDDILIKFKSIHKDRYDYSNVVYKNINSKIDIICKEHGSFSQTPKSHLNGANCPSCSIKVSKPEIYIFNYIKSIYQGEVIQSYRPSWLGFKELDIFIPEFNFAIEYNGTSFHHSSRSEHVDKFYISKNKQNSYHYNKWLCCFENNVTLLSIYDFYWVIKEKKLNYLSKIKHYLKLDSKVFARKCEIKEITNNIASDFYEINHLEGSGFLYKDSRSFGLYHKDQLVMCATVGQIYNQQNKQFKNKLQRICTLQNYTVVGGLSKLTNKLLETFDNFSYQITLSSGGSTLSFFDNYKIISPRYFWVNPNTLKYFHRNYCQKHLLEKHFKEPVLETDTESIYMEKLGYLKVFDNGLCELEIKRKA